MARPTLRAGASGLAVKTMQQGLRKALGAASENLANGAYGARTIRDVARFKRAHRIYADGTIFGQTAWRALEPFLNPVQRAVVAVTPTPVKSAEDVVRDRILAEALWLLAHASLFTYAQVRPMPVPPNLRDMRYVHRWDCSSTATACYHAAGAPDPNGRGYDGYGNTWMQVAHGAWVADLKPGDLCFYGPARNNPTHVAVYVGGGQVVSFGHTPPSRYPVHYRSDFLGARRYPLIA